MELTIRSDNPRWQELLDQFENERNLLATEMSSLRNLSLKGLPIANKYLMQLLATIEGYTFREEEEIFFYKYLKPFVQSFAIFYAQLHKMESERPPGVPANTELYYQTILEAVATTYRDHRFIREYLQSGATYLDDRLFFRSSNAVFPLNGLHPPADGAMPVSYDYVAAQLLAADMMEQRLLDSITALDFIDRSAVPPPTLTWTKPKAHFVELAYALFAAKVFNNGKAQLKDIVEHLERCCNIKSGNYHRVFQEILFRQSGYSVFQDDMKNDYLLYITRIEDKHIG